MSSDRMKQAILVVSFGTSFNSSRSITIGAIESTLAECFPEYTIRRAFTSKIIKAKLLKRDGIAIDNVEEALEKLSEDGFKRVYIQPTHIMEGEEYDLTVEAAKPYMDKFEVLRVGHALLTEDRDLDTLVDALDEATKKESDEETARVFMGHGTEHNANAVYTKLQKKAEEKGFNDLFIGTVEATPSLDDIAEMVKKSGHKKIVLSPMMIVAGDHANNDMAGDDEDSWKSRFQRDGLEVRCRIRGLGNEYEIQKMIAKKCKDLIEG